MVHPQEARNAWNARQRARAREEPRHPAGRLPYPNEIVGGHKAPPFEVNGLDALSPLLLHVNFPATKTDILEVIGQARIPIDQVTTTHVADIVERVAPEHFPSSKEFEAAAQRVIREMQPHYEDGRGARHWQGDNLNGRKFG